MNILERLVEKLGMIVLLLMCLMAIILGLAGIIAGFELLWYVVSKGLTP